MYNTVTLHIQCCSVSWEHLRTSWLLGAVFLLQDMLCYDFDYLFYSIFLFAVIPFRCWICQSDYTILLFFPSHSLTIIKWHSIQKLPFYFSLSIFSFNCSWSLHGWMKIFGYNSFSSFPILVIDPSLTYKAEQVLCYPTLSLAYFYFWQGLTKLPMLHQSSWVVGVLGVPGPFGDLNW